MEAINWREHARRLSLALSYHRTDMHNASKRPCPTCRFSKAALDAYLADVERERAALADETRPRTQEPPQQPTWSPEDLLRCIPFTDREIEAAIRRHERSACGGGCLSAHAGREVLRVRKEPRP